MISIVTPTYNSGAYLEECILSLMGQRYKDFEHIIVDGASTDHTLDIIRKYEGSYNMRWISEGDSGMYDAISKGFGMAQGEILSWLNSDDMYLPWALQLVAEVMKNSKIQWLTGIPSQFNKGGVNYCHCQKRLSFPRVLIKKGWMDGRRLGCIQQESTFWTKELYQKVGGINSSYQYAGDYHLWRSFAEYERLYIVNSVMAGFRIHPGQKSADTEAYFGELGPAGILTGLYRGLRLYSAGRSLFNFFEGENFIEVCSLTGNPSQL